MPTSHSSGDVLADQRVSYARGLAEDREFAAAAELVEQALERVPGWAAGWSLLGDYRTEAGNTAGAVAAWRRLRELDGDGVFGAELKLAAAGAAPMPEGAAVPYVTALFDDFAGRFEATLVNKLGYRAPELLDAAIRAELGARGTDRVELTLDLGCGTGLMGERLRPLTAELEGVDLSAGMIREAERKNIYDRLVEGELVEYLEAHPGGADLVVAADVLVYCGALEPIFRAVARVMRPGGLLAFTVEQHDGPEPVVVRPSLRHAHQPEATREALIKAGFAVHRFDRAVLRQDRGADIIGLVVVAGY